MRAHLLGRISPISPEQIDQRRDGAGLGDFRGGLAVTSSEAGEGGGGELLAHVVTLMEECDERRDASRGDDLLSVLGHVGQVRESCGRVLASFHPVIEVDLLIGTVTPGGWRRGDWRRGGWLLLCGCKGASWGWKVGLGLPTASWVGVRVWATARVSGER